MNKNNADKDDMLDDYELIYGASNQASAAKLESHGDNELEDGYTDHEIARLFEQSRIFPATELALEESQASSQFEEERAESLDDFEIHNPFVLPEHDAGFYATPKERHQSIVKQIRLIKEQPSVIRLNDSSIAITIGDTLATYALPRFHSGQESLIQIKVLQDMTLVKLGGIFASGYTSTRDTKQPTLCFATPELARRFQVDLIKALSNYDLSQNEDSLETHKLEVEAEEAAMDRKQTLRMVRNLAILVAVGVPTSGAVAFAMSFAALYARSLM
ncbi:hypothetical protein ACI2KR_30430 [Pseudomonas luteola]